MTCENLGIVKENRDFGPTLYQNFRLNTCQNLGVFHKNHVFCRQKTHGLLLLVKILGLLKSTKILGLHCIEIVGLALVKILGYLIRTMFLTAKTHGLLLLVKILGLLKSTKILGLHRIEIKPKTHCLHVLSKTWVL